MATPQKRAFPRGTRVGDVKRIAAYDSEKRRPLEALPSAWRVRRLLDRRFEAAGQVEDEWDRLPPEAREALPSPDELLAGG